MDVTFKFDYTLNLHNKRSYINAIDKDGVEEEVAFRRSLAEINKNDIKSITKMSDGTATLNMKNNIHIFETVESYDEIIDTIQKANVAIEIFKQDKVYIFDDFKVDDDELNVVNNWKNINNK